VRKNEKSHYADGGSPCSIANCGRLRYRAGGSQGSVLTGDYQGSFDSQYSWGKIKIKVYDGPDGSKPVFGELEPASGRVMGIFRGHMKGSRLEADFFQASGTVTGELSADGKTMSGTFTFANVLGPPGTWSAQKK
jgi:hypothetical protein